MKDENKIATTLLNYIDEWFNNELVMTAEDYDNLMLKAEEDVMED
jgi:hypothetical protein